MFSFLTKWFSKKAPDGKAIVSAHACPACGDQSCDCKAMSRRGFLGGLIAAAVAPTLILPVAKTIVTVPGVPWDLSRAYLRPLQAPLFDSEVFDFKDMPHVANYYKFNIGRSALKIKPGESFNARIVLPQLTFYQAGIKWDGGPNA